MTALRWLRFTIALVITAIVLVPVGVVVLLALRPGVNSTSHALLTFANLANVFRIFGTGLCVQYWDPDKAMGFFHEFSGWLVFLVSLGGLYLVHLSM